MSRGGCAVVAEGKTMATVVDEVTSGLLADVEADLHKRFDIVGGARDSSDVVVLLGLLNAGRVASASTQNSRRELCVGDPFAVIERWHVGGAQLGEFQQLWYRMCVPFGAAPLYWWYLLTLALREPGRSTEAAVEIFTAQLECFDALTASQRAAIVAGGLQATSREVIVSTGEVADTMLLGEAIVRDIPLIVVDGAHDVAELRASGWSVVDTDTTNAAAPPHELPTSAQLAGGQRLDVADLTSRTRTDWVALPADERTFVLTALQQRLDALEQMRFTCGGEVRENRAVVAVLETCRRTLPADWTYEQLVFATLARCWEHAGFILQEFNQSLLTLPLIATFLARRLQEYESITGTTAKAGPDLMTAAIELGRLRRTLELTHWRCIQFDGSNWERREFIVPKALRDDYLLVPASLADLLAARLGVELSDRSGSGAAWAAYLDAVLEAGRTPTQLLCAVVDWAANDDQLPMDASIFTVPHGIKLDSPWELEIDEVFCYTAFRDGFDPTEHGMPLDLTGIRNAIGQRMRYNAVKKAQNYALVKRFKPQSFNLPDIAVAEDANHAGHNAGGIRLSMRLPTWISYRGNEWRGIADVRFNRGGYHVDNRFRPSDVVVGSRLTAWEKGIADATYARDLLFDRRFCVKLTGPTGAQMPA